VLAKQIAMVKVVAEIRKLANEIAALRESARKAAKGSFSS
jgi:hypothetical protein